jgi:hypothetical protein
MRTLIVGSNFFHSWATESHLARDFTALGHDVRKMSERVALPLLEAACSDVDLVVYMKCYGLPPEATAMWQRLEARGVRTASYHLDLYYGLARQVEIGTDPFWRTGMVFTADGDPAMQAYCESLDVNHRWLPAGVVSDEVVRGKPLDKWRYPICFVGKVDGYHREWSWRLTMIELLHSHFKGDFRVWTHADQIWDLTSNDVYASTKVVVGDSLALPGHVNYWSNRYYETVGRGGLLVAPDVPGIETQFTEDSSDMPPDVWGDLILFDPGDTNDMLDAVEYALTFHREKRAELTAHGMATVAARHTYKHRIATMLDALEMT